ncbi:tetratricopeptide repeat protein [Mesorhizobium sp. BHbsci]
MPHLPRRQPFGVPAMVQDLLPSAGEPAPEILQRGIDLQRRKRFREAEFCYQTVLRRQPKNAMALNLMGTLAIEAQQNETAIDFMKARGEARTGQRHFPQQSRQRLQPDRQHRAGAQKRSSSTAGLSRHCAISANPTGANSKATSPRVSIAVRWRSTAIR